MMTNPLRARLFFCSATALLACAALAAQVPGGGGQQPSTPGQQPQSPTSPGTNSPGAYPQTATTPQSFGEQSFLTKAMEGSEAEVQLGQLAAQKSQSNDVKQFAQKMVAEHQQMQDKWFKPVAQQLGVSEPKGPSKKQKKEIERLQGLSGSDFDTEYIKCMLKDHQADLKDFKNEAEAAQDPNVKQIAQQGTNVISQHLQILEQLAKNHNVPVDNKGKEVSSAK